MIDKQKGSRMKKWYVYNGSKLVDVVEAYSSESAVRIARDRGTYAQSDVLTATGTIK
jgi:ABC-type tungstate transport system permease subunit